MSKASPEGPRAAWTRFRQRHRDLAMDARQDGIGDELGIDPARIAVGGESAGGGLAACLALLARDRGEIPLVVQLLIYPMLDDRTVTEAEPHPFAGAFIWTRDSNRFGRTSLLGCEPGGDEVSPCAAASRATDLKGLPPTFIAVGSLDLFLEQERQQQTDADRSRGHQAPASTVTRRPRHRREHRDEARRAPFQGSQRLGVGRDHDEVAPE